MDISRKLVMAGGRAFRDEVMKAMEAPAASPEKEEAIKDYTEHGKSMTKAELVEVIEKIIK